MSTNAIQQNRPWEDLPNPMGFEPLAEQVNHVSLLRGAIQTGPKRRTSPVGRDRFGIGFRAGDLILASLGGGSEVVEVKDIVLDDMGGNPHTSGPTLILDQKIGQLYSFRIHRAMARSNGPRSETVNLEPLDMGWLGTHLGLTDANANRRRYVSYTIQSLPSRYAAVELQSFKAKCQKLDGTGKSVILTQDKLTAYQDLPGDRQVLEAYIAARVLPVLRDVGIEIQV